MIYFQEPTDLYISNENRKKLKTSKLAWNLNKILGGK